MVDDRQPATVIGEGCAASVVDAAPKAQVHCSERSTGQNGNDTHGVSEART